MINEKTVAAIIPARSGSIGVFGKNFKHIFGRPLIEWSIQAAIQSQYIDDIIVTTNCKECEEISLSFAHPKIRIVRRPDNLATAQSRTEDCMIHAVDQMKQDYGIVCLLQPTSPARKNNLVDRCLEQMGPKRDSVIAVSAHTPFFWHKGSPLFSPGNRPMRQDLIKDRDFYFHDSGNFYAVEGSLLKETGRIGRIPVLWEVSSFEAMQIDTIDDFRAMESLAGVFGGFL